MGENADKFMKKTNSFILEMWLALIAWNEKFSVRVSRFDEEHKQLTNLINQLHGAVKTGQRGRSSGMSCKG